MEEEETHAHSCFQLRQTEAGVFVVCVGDAGVGVSVYVGVCG